MSNLKSVQDLEKLFATDPNADTISFVQATLDTVPALLGKFANVAQIRFDNCEIKAFDPGAFTAGSAKGNVDIEFSYTTFDSDALFEKALIHGLGTWKVQDYGFEYSRDARWKRIPALGDDGLGEEGFRRAAFDVLRDVPIEATDANLRLLDHSKKPIRDKAAAMFDQLRKSPLADGTVKAGDKAVILGTPLFHEKGAIEGKLAGLGITFVKTLKEATTVVVLPKPGAKLAEVLAKKLPLILEGHLRGNVVPAANSQGTVTEAKPKASATEADNLDKLLFSGDAKNTLLGLSLAKARTLEGATLANVVAVAFFSEEAAVRKEGRALLLAHAPDAVRNYLQGDKRNYVSLTDGGKLTKLVKLFEPLGVPAQAFSIAMMRVFKLRDGAPWNVEPALEAALAFHPNEEPTVLAWLADEAEVSLTFKKTLPKGVSKLKALKYLRLRHVTIKSDANFAEIATLPQPISLDYWVKDTNLSYFKKCATNIRALFLRGKYSNLYDISELKNFTNLAEIDLEDTGITDLEPLRELPLVWLRVSNTAILSLEPIRGKALIFLDIANFKGDLAILPTLTAMTNLRLNGTNVADLSFVSAMPGLTTLDLQGTQVAQLDPLAGSKLTHLTLSFLPKLTSLKPLLKCPNLISLYLYNTKVDEEEVASLRAALPNLYINR